MLKYRSDPASIKNTYKRFITETAIDPQFIATLRVAPRKTWMDTNSELLKLEGFVNRSLVSSHAWKKPRYSDQRISLIGVLEGLSQNQNNHIHGIWLSRTAISQSALEEAIDRFVRGSRIFHRPWLAPVIKAELDGMISYMTKENKTCEIDLADPEFPDRIYWPEPNVIPV